jgi:hypothetical protein
MNYSRFTLLAALLLLPVLARGEELPDGMQVLERYIEATGGRAAYEKIASRTASGTFSVPAANIEGKLTLIQTADAARITVELVGIGTVEQGKTPQGIVWENSPVTGPRLIEGPEADRTAQQLRLNPELRAHELYKTIETTGIELIDDQPAYVVRFVSHSGQEETRYYSKDTGLLLRTQMVAATQLGDVAVVVNVGDYKDFDGVKLPTRARQQMMGLEQTITLLAVEHNKPIADDQLAPPEGVARLIEARAAASEPSPTADDP